MTAVAQFTFDFQNAEAERALMDQWEANERAQAAQFTTEMYAMHYCGIHHKEDWETLPRYERDRIVRMYKQEQADLEWAIERWEPLYELFLPDGSHRTMPPRPRCICEFSKANGLPIDKKEMDDFHARAQALANRLSADWSANRPASEHTYDPFLAAEVSLILGRKIESVYPPPEVADGVPVLWKIFTVLQKNPLQ